MRARALTVIGALLCLALAVAGCGGDSEAETESFAPPPLTPEQRAPKGSSPVLKEIYRQFPKPKPDPGVKGSAKTIKKGEEACKGKSPSEVKAQYIDESDLLPDQAEMVAKLGSYENNRAQDSSFVAGQLAALVYEQTLPSEKLASYGYQGCIYVMALRLKRQLAPR